jgi:hypothetical protein
VTLRRCLLPLVVAAAGALGACSDDAPVAAERPAGLAEVREVFAADLAEMGLRLTDRGGVVDVEGGYTPSPTGTHLSLYVEPVGDRSDAEYVDGILDTARLLGPELFERWSAIESFDVCQEPPTAVDDADEPAPYTRLDMRRARVEALEWDALTVPAFLATARELAGDGMSLFVGAPIRASDAFEAALDEAGLSR